MEFREYSLLLPNNIKNEINNINIQPVINFISSGSRSIKNKTELELNLVTIRKVKNLLLDYLITNYKITDDQINNMFKHIKEKIITGTKDIMAGGDENDYRVKRAYILNAGVILMRGCLGEGGPIERIICRIGGLILICCLIDMIYNYLLDPNNIKNTLDTLKTNVDTLKTEIPEYIKNITHFLRQLFQIDNVSGLGVGFRNIDDLPIIPVAEDVTDRDPECAICSEPFATGGEMSQLPCSHVYHTNCINTWLTRNRNCPLCREELRNNTPAAIERVLPADPYVPTLPDNQPIPIPDVDGARPIDWVGYLNPDGIENRYTELDVHETISRQTKKKKIINTIRSAIRFISSKRLWVRRNTSMTIVDTGERGERIDNSHRSHRSTSTGRPTGGKTKKKRNKKSYTRQKKGNIKNHRKSKRSRRRSRR